MLCVCVILVCDGGGDSFLSLLYLVGMLVSMTSAYFEDVGRGCNHLCLNCFADFSTAHSLPNQFVIRLIPIYPCM